MSIPIIYADTQYVAAKHSFKTIPEGTNLSLTSLTSITTNNVMTLKEANVGIGTTAPRQLLDVQGGNAIVSGSIGIGTTVARQLLDVQGGNAIVSGSIGVGTTVARQLLDIQGGDIIATGNIGVGTTAPIHSLHVGRQSYFNGNVGIGTTIPRQLLDVQGGNSIFSGNAGIGTTNADWRLVVGNNTTRDEFIKVDSRGFAGLILNGDSVNTAGEVGGAYVELRIDAGTNKGVLALNQVDGQDGRGDTLTGSIANGLVLHHTGNYPIQFGTGGTVKMTVVSGGFVGIGTTDPQYKLHVNGTAQVDSTLYVGGAADVNEVQADDGDAGDPSFTFRSDTDTGMYRAATNNIGFSAGGSESVRITTSGLRVYGQYTIYSDASTYAGTITTTAGADNVTVEARDVLFLESEGAGTTNVVRSLTTYNNGTASGANVFVNSAGTLFRSTSSIRYKKDITTMENSIADNILQCRAVKYKAIDPKEVPIDWTYYGFIAEEVALIEPRLVTYNKNNEPDGVQYDRFVPLLLNLIQRQHTTIQTLETKVQEQKQNYDTLIQTLQSKGIL